MAKRNGIIINDLKQYNVQEIKRAIPTEGSDLYWAQYLQGNGQYEEALSYWEKLLGAEMQREVAWHNKALCYRALGRCKEAIECHTIALKLNNNKTSFIREMKSTLDDCEDINLNAKIDEISELLGRKTQVILFGPPGTGKTYLAIETVKKLCKYINKDTYNGCNDYISICTFHPSYGYEDFIEGYRPGVLDAQSADHGSIYFELRDGIFKKLCKKAQKSVNRDKCFYLIIDEINRGDIPRIFGELITIMEKSMRDTEIYLPYSREHFHIPKNVYIIGTMNTTDRSIALLDVALRRRFALIQMMPDPSILEGSIDGIDLCDWLTGLNHRILETLGQDLLDFQIGHSYLMENTKTITDISAFTLAIQDDIVPLLEEYCSQDFSKMNKILGDDIIDVDVGVKEDIFDEAKRDILGTI